MQFTQDFFKPEIREEFEIPAMMKRAWAAQMEVLQVVADICEENGLQYFADGGTLLGAVRHQGFIPWDDDIDICLKREDYNRLISILQRQLPYGFVVSGMYARTVRLRMAANVSHLRVIADETLWNFNDYMKYFHGFPYQRAGIDIFPLDYIPVEAKLADIQKIMMIQGMNLLENWTTLEKAGKLKGVVTQNIDGLHQKAGSKNVMELHGSVLRNYCERCGQFVSAEDILHSEGVPVCPVCGGPVKPDVVLYEEGLNQKTLQDAVFYISHADMLIVGGTSLAVYPAAGLIDYYRGNKLVLINKSATPMDARADLLIQDGLGNVFSQIKC